jgi:hypothetical protein
MTKVVGENQMQWLGWVAEQHVWAVIIAIAAGLLLPWPLLAAQRAGRGIKPWWTTSRFLAWAGLLGAAAALLTGEFLAKRLGLLGDEWILRGQWSDMRIHQYFGGATVFFGSLCLRFSYLKRKEHQGMGALVLLSGLLWAISAGGAGASGIKLARGSAAEAKAAVKQQTKGATGSGPVDGDELISNQRNRLLRILDYPSLVPMHQEPIRSSAHNNRWIRVWVSPEAAENYASGSQLPEGALVVMSSIEDRWGRPGYEIGPLYTLEMLPAGPRVGMYWSYVPESKRGEVGGLSRVSWREPNENLARCAECHANGMALPSLRNRNKPRKTEAETQAAQPPQQEPPIGQ